MSKGIAIETILMLLVGILVVGVVVYMVYRYMFSPGLNEQDCRSAAVNYCTTCKNSADPNPPYTWSASISAPASLTACAGKYFPTYFDGRCDMDVDWCPSFGISP
jgi:hypothetical protein